MRPRDPELLTAMPGPVVALLLLLDASDRLASALASTIGNNGAPAMRDCASACTTRATAAAMSRLEVIASSIRSVSSLDPKPRHHTTDGSVLSGLRGPSR